FRQTEGAMTGGTGIPPAYFRGGHRSFIRFDQGPLAFICCQWRRSAIARGSTLAADRLSSSSLSVNPNRVSLWGRYGNSFLFCRSLARDSMALPSLRPCDVSVTTP